jgi:general secretion pathway protein E
MAQRLIRRLDDATKQEYQPSGEEMKLLHDIVNTLPESVEKPNLEGIRLYKPGSSADNPFGYKGQVPIREQFTMDGAVRELFETKHDGILTAHQIEAAAAKSGMRTMLQDAILKVCAGETTLDEVFRVVG